MSSIDKNEQGSTSAHQLSATQTQRQQTHISEEIQAQIDRILLQSRREAENYKLESEKSQAELREARREIKSIKDENEALRIQAELSKDEFLIEKKERRRAQDELQSTRTQLQQLQRQIGKHQCLHGATSYECRPTLPGCGHFMRVGLDVCDNAASKSDSDPDRDHTRSSSPTINAGGRRQSPVSVSRPASRTNDDNDRSSPLTTRFGEQQGPRT